VERNFRAGALVPALLVSALVLFSLAPSGLCRDGKRRLFEVERPKKLFNLKLAPGLYTVQRTNDGLLCSDTNRFVMQLGLQYGQFPWMAEFNFYTNIAIEIYAGFYWPAVKLGRGWLTFTVGPFYKSSKELWMSDSKEGCAGQVYDDFASTLGLGLSVDYQLLDGYVSFFVEAKQSIYFEPVGTTIVGGINVSPLILLLLRQL